MEDLQWWGLPVCLCLSLPLSLCEQTHHHPIPPPTTTNHRAARAGNAAVALFLLQRGCAPNAPSVVGETPLHWAAREGKLRAVEVGGPGLIWSSTYTHTHTPTQTYTHTHPQTYTHTYTHTLTLNPLRPTHHQLPTDPDRQRHTHLHKLSLSLQTDPDRQRPLPLLKHNPLRPTPITTDRP